MPPRYVTEGAGEGSTFRANRSVFARAIVAGNDNGGCTRHKDPGPSHLLREESVFVPIAQAHRDYAVT